MNIIEPPCRLMPTLVIHGPRRTDTPRNDTVIIDTNDIDCLHHTKGGNDLIDLTAREPGHWIRIDTLAPARQTLRLEGGHNVIDASGDVSLTIDGDRIAWPMPANTLRLPGVKRRDAKLSRDGTDLHTRFPNGDIKLLRFHSLDGDMISAIKFKGRETIRLSKESDLRTGSETGSSRGTRRDDRIVSTGNNDIVHPGPETVTSCYAAPSTESSTGEAEFHRENGQCSRQQLLNRQWGPSGSNPHGNQTTS